ncbi:peroxidase 5 [Selaginella moellendorffii]|nr:peroxidase 5 [Selaginella moellendorffii]|eukprot:XP_002976191.2 peroxidase 5 [Selaginella moellendorffii]
MTYGCLVLVFFLAFGFRLFFSEDTLPAGMAYNYYSKSCPLAEQVIYQTMVIAKQLHAGITSDVTRLAFHDAFVEGCDASALIKSTPGNLAEMNASVNKFLEGFELIDAAKFQLEILCPNTVSCADIIQFAARDGVRLDGGPFYALPGGRLDGRVSKASRATQFLPLPTMNVSELKANFAAKNFTLEELATLSGAHTIGESHCSSFKDRLYNFTGNGDQDPSLDPTYARELKAKCPQSATSDDTVPMESEPSTSKVNTVYYRDILRSKSIFTSDQTLVNDPITRATVVQFANNTEIFFQKFAAAMLKMSLLEVNKPGGEIRYNCGSIN